MNKLNDPEVEFATHLSRLEEMAKLNFLIGAWKASAESRHIEAEKLETKLAELEEKYEEYEYYEERDRKQRDHILRLQEAIKGTDNARLERRIGVLKAELMAYNGDLVLDECEISEDEMRGILAEKITIPVTAEA